MKLTRRIQASQRSPLLQVLKTSVATAVAWIVSGLLLPGELPVFAAIASLLVVQPSINQSFAKAIERSVGVIAGVILATLISLALGQNSWIVILAILVAVLLSWVFKMTPGTGNQVAISAMLVLALGSSSPEYALDRIIETLIGAAVGFAVNLLIVPPVLVTPVRDSIARLGNELAASLERLASAMRAPQREADLEALMIEVRLLRPMREAADAAITDGEESLTLNPRKSSHRGDLKELSEVLDRLTPVVTQVIGMTRAFRDHYDDDLHAEPTVTAIAGELTRAAHDLRLVMRPAFIEPEPMTSEFPALTAPLQISPPQSTHWVLIGSLMEDLRRIREELLIDDPD
ncbi:Aromatic acid exporter family member 1 [Paramicrobacterium humi]|uniref:Aromatic acid exporter family member 1 n=1 Tax=Paramicrobacterium humi TaxID=640635 RepID=A0A1H4QAT6_9MICO|nr:FUSC family protein [Microbacterium humi]SEC16711.1 Aromatic acid exporter family member 1 [Microbacterium humi]